MKSNFLIKTVSFILALLMLLSLISCSGGGKVNVTDAVTTAAQITEAPKSEEEIALANMLNSYALQGAQNMINNYWEGGVESVYVMSSHTQKVWRPGMLVLGFETM